MINFGALFPGIEGAAGKTYFVAGDTDGDGFMQEF
jgi:hypothetical protein